MEKDHILFCLNYVKRKNVYGMDIFGYCRIFGNYMRVSEPYKRASRSFHPQDTVVDIGDIKIGGKKIAVIAGPCSVESQEQIDGIAKAVKLSGASMLRGGAFKPRTSPYSFQGLRDSGLEMLHHDLEKLFDRSKAVDYFISKSFKVALMLFHL